MWNEKVSEVTGFSQVLLANNGKEGVLIFEENMSDIQLVLLDMVMPEMGRRECFSKRRELNSDIGVIIMTGFADDADLEEMRKNGVKRVISKPYVFSSFSKAISEVLGAPKG